jgi:hypothetical protein
VTPFSSAIAGLGIGRTMLLCKNFFAKLGIEFSGRRVRVQAPTPTSPEQAAGGYKRQMGEILTASTTNG